MSAGIIIRCDVPGCPSQYGHTSPFAAESMTTKRGHAKRDEGWSTTRVPNPFYDAETASFWTKTCELDRCARHRDTRLQMLKTDNGHYQIDLR